MWKGIENAPRDGRPLVCWKPGWDDWAVREWKYNRRTDRSYFGDLSEDDDYDMADDQPEYWFDFPAFPAVEEGEDEPPAKEGEEP